MFQYQGRKWAMNTDLVTRIKAWEYEPTYCKLAVKSFCGNLADVCRFNVLLSKAGETMNTPHSKSTTEFPQPSLLS
jgi:hypothetical protein